MKPEGRRRKAEGPHAKSAKPPREKRKQTEYNFADKGTPKCNPRTKEERSGKQLGNEKNLATLRLESYALSELSPPQPARRLALRLRLRLSRARLSHRRRPAATPIPPSRVLPRLHRNRLHCAASLSALGSTLILEQPARACPRMGFPAGCHLCDAILSLLLVCRLVVRRRSRDSLLVGCRLAPAALAAKPPFELLHGEPTTDDRQPTTPSYFSQMLQSGMR